MTKITVLPGKNIFNRNYKGSTCYCRYNSVIIRQKHITKRNSLPQLSVVRSLFKKSSALYKTLSPYEKQTFIDYVESSGKSRSGLNVMTGFNISTNYLDQLCFYLIKSIAAPPVAPEIPLTYTVIVSYPYKRFRVVLDTEYPSPVKIKIYYCLKNGSWFSKSDPFTYLDYFYSNSDYKQISWLPYIGYQFMFIKCSSIGDSNLESELGNFSVICPV